MSWRTVVISSSAKLDYHMGYMVVRKDEEIKIHIQQWLMRISITLSKTGHRQD